MSRWFRVFDLEEARWRWDNWSEMSEADEDEESPPLEEPALPACVEPNMPMLPQAAFSLARSKRAKALIKAVKTLAEISQSPHPELVTLSEDDQEEIYPDSDPDVPMLALAFGEHDVIHGIPESGNRKCGTSRAPALAHYQDGRHPAELHPRCLRLRGCGAPYAGGRRSRPAARARI